MLVTEQSMHMSLSYCLLWLLSMEETSTGLKLLNTEMQSIYSLHTSMMAYTKHNWYMDSKPEKEEAYNH